ncbi:uncharacterized protein LOC124441649 [Xenia sp. Carnegie-2017]|uniref:uncharacterized protein LOC124441649 n=1 Tax=Xenia sp. Carnegie-2017 TaxID=2897299 RepID=UPI001F035CF4|nr:uncharacterized protein LOC124441649 [Xenia sp. Carnegie-2017]
MSSGHKFVSSSYWLVSHGGTNHDNCGNWTTPCQTLRYAVRLSNDNDEIYVDYAGGRPYMECEKRAYDSTSINLNKSLSIFGRNGRALIVCNKKGWPLFRVQNGQLNISKIGLHNLILKSTGTAVDCNEATTFALTIENLTISDDLRGVSSKKSLNCFINVRNSLFEGAKQGGIDLTCSNLTVNIKNNIFRSSPVILKTVYRKTYENKTSNFVLFVENTVFDGERILLHSSLLEIKPYANIFNATVWSTTFIDHYARTPNKQKYVPLLIRDQNVRNRILTAVSIKKINAENNLNQHAAVRCTVLSIIGNSFKVQIVNNTFRNNSAALHIYLLHSNKHLNGKFNNGRQWKPVILKNNLFIDNGQSNPSGISSIVLEKGHYLMISCRFCDNRMGKDPSKAIIQVMDVRRVIFRNCRFKNWQRDTGATQFYLQDSSPVYFKGKNVFIFNALNMGQTVLMRSSQKGNCRLFVKGNFTVVCPHGYTISFEKHCPFRYSYFQCRYLYLRCNECPLKTYALERSKFTITKRNDVKCMQCPRGGICNGGVLSSRPNFWGYKSRSSITFAQCPPGYCCNLAHCVTYNNCQGNRTGTLCGRCLRGMSDSLFSTSCTLNSDCSVNAFIPSAMALLILYLIFFLFHHDVECFFIEGFRVYKGIFRRQGLQVAKERNSGLLKIFFYYYQVFRLLQSVVGGGKRNIFLSQLGDDVLRLVHLIPVDFSSFTCPLPSLLPIQKAIIVHSIGYCLLVLLGLIFLFTKIILMFLKHCKNEENELLLLASNFSSSPSSSTFKSRIFSAYTYVALLMYASSTKLCFSLLHCVRIGDDNVLFLDGNIKCYQPFQYVFIGYVASSVFPFCLVPVLGAYLLRTGRISASHFCFSCLIPLPFCCFWLYLLMKDYIIFKRDFNESRSPSSFRVLHIDHLVTRRRPGNSEKGKAQVSNESQIYNDEVGFSNSGSNAQNQLGDQSYSEERNELLNNNSEMSSDEERDIREYGNSESLQGNKGYHQDDDKASVLRVLLTPFRTHEAFLCFPQSKIPWEGFLVFRRLIIILVLTFVQDNRVKMILALTICAAILAFHTYVKPFVNPRDNVIESISLFCHVILCGLTLIKCIYYGEDLSPSSNSQNIFPSFDMIQNVLLITPIAILMLVLILSIFGRLLIVIQKCFRVIQLSFELFNDCYRGRT